MLNKIKVSEAERFSKSLNSVTYPLNPYWLAFRGFYEKKQELLIYERDIVYENDFPFLILPNNKSNWINAIITNSSAEDLERIRKANIKIKESFIFGEEYYYDTNEFVSLSNKNFRKSVKSFKKRYKYNVKTQYPKEKIIEFLKKWQKTQITKNNLFNISHEFEIFCIERCKNIMGNWLYIEVDNKLVGYCLSYKINNDSWIGVHQKVDYSYEGLSRFLLHQRASQFADTKVFTLGSEAKDEGIKEFKESLHPIKKIARHYIITAN